MSSCSNSSNLLGNVNINDISGSGARLLMTLPLSGFSGSGVIQTTPEMTDGITYGNAIRYDNVTDSTSYGKYIKAKADSPANSEVVGIVETVDVNNSSVVIVINGQINYPEDKLITATHVDVDAGVTGSAGGNDVYFLSAVTGGLLQNLAPTEPTQVIKPIYQVAPDSPFTGQVVNYIGYQSGGQVVASQDSENPTGSMRFVPEIFETPNRDGWFDLGASFNLNEEEGNTFINSYNKVGHLCQTSLRIYTVETPSRSMVDTVFSIKNAGKTLITGKVQGVNVAQSYIDVLCDSIYFNKFDSSIVAGRFVSVKNGGLLTVSDNGFKKLSYTWPKLSKNNTWLNIKVTDGIKETQLPLNVMVFNPRDAIAGNGTTRYTHAISLANNLELNELSVTTLVAENDDVKVSDVANAFNTMQDDIAALKSSVNGDQNATNSSIEKK